MLLDPLMYGSTPVAIVIIYIFGLKSYTLIEPVLYVDAGWAEFCATCDAADSASGWYV